MIDRRPTTRSEMLDVSGVGPAKLDQYGDAFLEALQCAD
jgi:superfamily II DNA helicase RecQ